MNKYYVIILLIPIFFLFSLVYAGDYNQELKQFVLDTYRDYGAGEFEKVYERFHPLIKEKLSKEKYLQYQGNVDQYDLVIEKTDVIEVSKINTIPGKLGEIFPSDFTFSCYEVQIKYTAEFDTAVGRQKREIEKEVHLAAGKEGDEQKIYLLWDPSVIDKEET